MAKEWRSVALAALLLSAMVSAGAAAKSDSGHTRVLAQATAVATSVARASPGSTAISNVRAGAVSTGTPTTAVAQGASIAEAGATVVTQCDVYAKDTEQYKACINTPPPAKTNVSANATAAAQEGVVSWAAAPTCTPPISTNATPDNLGRLWGYENGSSCVYRFADFSPVYSSNASAVASANASANAAVGVPTNVAAVSFAAAPTCSGKPTDSNSTLDASGRLWGFENGTSCAYKDPSGNALYLPPAAPAPAPAPPPIQASPSPPPPPPPPPSPSPAPAAPSSASATAAAAAKAGGGGRRRLMRRLRRHATL